jgi:2,4-dienoyl-CoA reductase-like NADH-dependent reductase (Old Yellow Enzyme family)
MAKVIKEASGKMMLVNGGIIDGLGTEAVFDTGAGDAAVVGRPLFAQPDWPHIIRSGIDYPWAEFDRKYVIQPPVDLGLCYPMDRYVTNWNPDTSKRR